VLRRLDVGLEETERQLTAADTSHWLGLVDMAVAECHPAQRDFVLDPGDLIAALVGRGGGKTMGGAVRFLRRMLTTPGANCFYLAKFRDHAKRLLWEPLKKIFRNLGFVTGKDVIYNESTLRVFLPKNGARLQLFGADKPGYIESLRGESYHEVGIDEAASHGDELIKLLIDSVIGPRLLGALWLIGTPGRRLKGLFYDVTRRGSELGQLHKERTAESTRPWTVHKWSLASAIEATRDRPIAALLELYEVQQKRIREAGYAEDHPIKRREYDGEWASDDTINVYSYRPHNLETGEVWNQWDPERVGPLGVAKLPAGFAKWIHVLAMDPGYSDPTAINLFAFSPEDPTRTIYHRWCFELRGLTAQLTANAIMGPRPEFTPAAPGALIGAIGGWPAGMIADTAHQMSEAVLAELSSVYGIHFDPAKKGLNYKIGAIDVVNGDLVAGRIKVLKDSELEEQLLDLQWDESKSGKQIERPGQPNHSTDCLVYGRVKLAEFMTSAPPPVADSRAPGYVPRPPPATGDYSHMFQDNYAALLD
jgi:hypothetical protein